MRSFFQRAGFHADEITDADVSLNREQPRDKDGKPVGPQRLTVSRSIQLRTNDVMKARLAYTRQAELLRDGVELSGSSISYTFTGLNSLKPDMIAEATQNARRSAEQFARDSGSRLGGIVRANQGVFEILPRDKAPMLQQDKQIDKTLRVVATLDYALVD